ncbi:hypothetical protein GCM10022243_08230 [Saccharothrix violaceirubra]|uniref:Excreted virulence factor EspC (Type VII ESX diderm) n=1 Tax=Saccharothrix violaceirubra TaxID=413306 RepID=A0A7W7SYK0_9PSEU|nr:type VII secretion target [Saccharothrix violaceirubra]MBB4963235.1 hypothetical protein [Saccharothrix violaceirubra]
MSGFKVQAQQLRTFASGQAERQGQVEQAASDVAGVDLGGETFGVLLQFFADAAQDFAAQTTEGIKQLAAAYGDASADTVATAVEYEQVEDGNQQTFDGGR